MAGSNYDLAPHGKHIAAKLGKGGMGKVYRATDSNLGRNCRAQDSAAVFRLRRRPHGRFEREAKVLAALNHPNIAQIYGVEHRALVMELVVGEIRSRRVGPGAFEGV